ncbi:MAG: ATP-binding protein [Sulfitobacter sp.]
MGKTKINTAKRLTHFARYLKRKQTAVFCALALVAMTVFLSALSYKIETLTYESHIQDIKLKTTIEMVEVRERIKNSLISRVFALNELATIVSQNPDMNAAQFNIKAVDFILDNPDVKFVAAAPDLVVSMVFPKTGNEKTLGLDYNDRPEYLPMIEAALRSGDSVMNGPIELLAGGRGLILRTPVLTLNASGQRDPWGILSAVLDYDMFFNNMGISEYEENYDILIHNKSVEFNQNGEVLLGDGSVLAKDPVFLNLNLPFGTWELAAITDGGWPPHLPNHITRIISYSLVILASVIAFGLVLRLYTKRREADRMLSVGIEALEHGFVMFDADRRLVAFNKRYKEIAGGSGMVRIGARYEDIVKANLRLGLIPDAIGNEDEWYEQWSQRLDIEVTDNEQILADGTFIRAYDRSMDCGAVVGLRIDVSDLKIAQREAEAANRAKTEFMGVLSHELRTPLTIILGHARLAQNIVKMPVYAKLVAEIEKHPEISAELMPMLDDVVKKFSTMTQSIENSGNQLYTLISEILDFAKIESGTLAMDFNQTTVPKIVESVVEQMRPMVENKGLSLEVSTVNCDINVDAKRIQQVLINLIGNASKFTEQGTITVTTTASNGAVSFQVKDTGIGIPEDEIENVFEAFHQVDSTSTRKHNGTGLGLAISRDIAIAHKGELTAQSVIGKGSTFTMTLPRLAAPKSDDDADDTWQDDAEHQTLAA